MSRWLSAIMVALVGLVAMASPAQAQYPPVLPPPTLVVSQDTGPPSYAFTATVTNCLPGQTVVFVLGDQRIEAVCNPTSLQATVTLTAPPALGTYTVTAEVAGTVLTATILVAADPPSTLPETGGDTGDGTGTGTGTGGGNGTRLPSTGSDGVSATLRTGLTLLVLGGGFLVVGRKRRRNPV